MINFSRCDVVSHHRLMSVTYSSRYGVESHNARLISNKSSLKINHIIYYLNCVN